MKALAVLAVLCAAVLSGCGIIPGAQSIEKDPIVVNGNSQFTEEGITAIKSSRKVYFDVTTLPLPMSTLGFPEGSDGTMISAESDQLWDVTIKTPSGLVEMQTDRIRIRPGGMAHSVNNIDIFINYPDAQDANQEIRRAANELGFVALEQAKEIGPDFKDGSGKDEWYPGFGNKTGTVFSAEIRSNRTTGRMTFIYSVHLADEYYTPEAEAGIASTGMP